MREITLNIKKKQRYSHNYLGTCFALLLTLLSMGASAQTVNLGSGTAVSDDASGYDLGPVSSYYQYMRYQVVYTAAEITAAGGTAGIVSQFGWNASEASAVVLPNYKIRMALTTATNSATHNNALLTEVYSNNFTSVTGYNMFTLTAPFVWDGVSNILVDVCYGAAEYVGPYGQVYVYGTEDNSSRFIRSDEDALCSEATDIINSFKPQARFVFAPATGCFQPSVITPSAITSNSATISWSVPVGAPALGYEYVVSTVNTTPSGSGTATTASTVTTPATLSPTTTYYAFVRTQCTSGFSAWGSVSFTTQCVTPTLTFTPPAAICGQGSAQLAADSPGYVSWYTVPQGGAAVALGENYTTPLLTQSTNYYVQASASGPQNVGPIYDGSETNDDYAGDHGIAFTTTEPETVIYSADIPFTGTGTFTVSLWDEDANELTSVTTGQITGQGDTAVTVPLNITVAQPGDYYLILREVTGSVYDLGYTEDTDYPYETQDGSFSITDGYWYGETPEYLYFFNLSVSNNSCVSARQLVAVTVNPATPVTAAATDALICNGDSTQISATSTNAGYSYVWMPGNLTGATQTVSPTATTTYTVTATDTASGCVAIGAVTVTVSTLPGTLNATNDVAICESASAVALTATGGVTNNVILSESFNGATNNWTTINNSTGEEEAGITAWTLRPDGYDYYDSVFHSSDNSQFYLSNSDAGGFDSTTSTILRSPSFSTVGYTTASVAFDHFFLEPTEGDSTGRVEASTNGTSWTTLQTYNFNDAEDIDFSLATVPLTAAFINQPTVYVRFKFDGEYRYVWAIDAVVISGTQIPAITWAPVAGLYTDAAATTAYTGGTAATVYAKPTATTTYTATATNTAGCTTTDTVVVTITATPQPTAAANQTFCGSATVAGLTTTSGTNIQWYAAATGGTALAPATALTTGTTYYASQTANGCESSQRTAVAVTIANTVADDPADVTACNQYVLPALTNGAYYTATNGGGTMLAAGTTIDATTTLYVFAQSGTTPNCTAEHSFVVTINSAAPLQGVSPQSITVETGGAATIEDIVVTATGTVHWYATESDVIAGVPLPAGTPLVEGATYYGTQTVGDCPSSSVLAVTISEILGNNTFNARAFSYYPNPVKDVLNLSYSSDITSVTVFNLLGQQLLAKQPNAATAVIDMTALAEGTYLVNVVAGTTIKTIKVIKKQ